MAIARINTMIIEQDDEAEGVWHMRNVSKIMCDIVAQNNFSDFTNDREYGGVQDSKFLNVEARIQSVMPMCNFFDQCSDDYKPDKDFIDQPYT